MKLIELDSIVKYKVSRWTPADNGKYVEQEVIGRVLAITTGKDFETYTIVDEKELQIDSRVKPEEIIEVL